MNLQHRHILVAPLDWGMGHTSRCVPLIANLLAAGHLVTVAGNTWQRNHIKEIFGNINFIHLDGYGITYARTAWATKMHLLQSAPLIRQNIAKEHKWLQNVVTDVKPDLILSDNRYGLYHHNVPSIIMTHQLEIQTGLGKTADRMLRQLHYGMLRPFGQVWVPDLPADRGLGFRLSHPTTLPQQASYIGLLSQFDGEATAAGGDHLLVLLSGPEPQRTILAQLLWQQLIHYNGQVVFVAGSDDAETPAEIPEHISYHKRLSGTALQQVVHHANMVICRSGYSSIMDLIRLRRKAIIIPTPGQTEQEYLAHKLHQHGLFYTAPQAGFRLAHALASAAHFPYHNSYDGADFELFQAPLTSTLAAL